MLSYSNRNRECIVFFFLGTGKKNVNALIDFRQYMTLDEVFAHLDLLQCLSNRENGKTELTTYLPVILILFKRLLVEYDNSEMNIIITNILNNIVSKNMVKEPVLPKTMVIADIATEVREKLDKNNIQFKALKAKAK
jgi:hypothetical protein